MTNRTFIGALVGACAAVVLTGCPVGFDLDLSRSSLTFEDVEVGSADDEGLDVLLDFGGPAELTATIEPPGAPFAIVQQPDPVLDTGDPTFVAVRFQPTEAGEHLAVLGLTISNVQGSARRDVALRGVGLLGAIDLDRDGYVGDEDCDEEDPLTHPNAPEQCDGEDNDCDGLLPSNESDFDNDGIATCEGDCSDDDPSTYPGAAEICDGVDNDCDGDLGEADDDGDGFRVCDGDCEDDNAFVFPGAPELCNAADDDCDGSLPADEVDADGDGWHICAGDCADDDPTRFPTAEEQCNGLDDSCDAIVPPDEVDEDGDGFFACEDCDDDDPTLFPGGVEECDGLDTDCDNVIPADEVDGDGDTFLACAECDDADNATFPGATEVCDGADNDCDGVTPADEVDDDGDTFLACEDCDDTEASVHPGASELCDGVDTNCDTVLPEDEVDDDGDGSFACEDCDDDDATSFPGASELCDYADNDCDGVIPDDELDNDGDGDVECLTDCDDDDATIYGGAPEECFDEVDNDCDGLVNQSCTCPIWGYNLALSGCSPSDYGSWECPWPLADLAVDSAAGSATCNEAWLRPATYNEEITIDGEVVLRSSGDRTGVVIDPLGASRAITIESGSVVTIQHVTVTGGLAEEGGGLFAEEAVLVMEDVLFEANECDAGGQGGAVYVDAVDLDVQQVDFLDNDCGYGGVDDGNDGGGMYVVDSYGTVAACTFEGNTAGDGSALYVHGGEDYLTVANSSFLDNETLDSDNPLGEVEGGALVVDADTFFVLNNVFAGNEALAGGGGITVGANHGGGTLVVNNVLVYNDSPQGGGIHFEAFSLTSGSGGFNNNIIAFNQGYGAFTDGASFPSDFQYNDVFGNSDGAFGALLGVPATPLNNLYSDPLFVSLTNDGDWTNDDLALTSPDSPCIDAGDPNPAFNDADTTRNDMGIYGGPSGDWIWPLP